MNDEVAKTMEVMERRRTLAKEIEKQSQAVYALSQRAVYSTNLAAHVAEKLRKMKDDFNRSLDRLSMPQKRHHDKMALELDEKNKDASKCKEQYAQAQQELDRMKQELKDLELPEVSEKFVIADIEKLITKRVASWLSTIKAIVAVIVELKAKREILTAQMAQLSPDPLSLDDQSLIGADVDAHHATMTAATQCTEKAQTIENLIGQLDQAIVNNETQLKAVRADFCETLRQVVGNYKKLAAGQIAQQLQQVLETDTFYFETVQKGCNAVIQKAGLNINQVFQRDCTALSSDPMQSPLKDGSELEAMIKKFINRIMVLN